MSTEPEIPADIEALFLEAVVAFDNDRAAWRCPACEARAPDADEPHAEGCAFAAWFPGYYRRSVGVSACKADNHRTEYETRTLTLVLQAVLPVGNRAAPVFAVALQEYAADVLRGEGGVGQFERHITANKVRIEAIASIAPDPREVRREGLAPTDAIAAAVQRLETAREMADYLAGGESTGQVADLAGMTPEQAATDVRELLDEVIQALPESRPPDSKL